MFSIDSDATYRLSFSGVGDPLSVQLVNLTIAEATVQEHTLPPPDMPISHGPVGLWLQGSDSRVGKVTVDNFFSTGTKP